ncbi:MAG: MBL fold metallo-hydrolase [Caldilineaceae bacterium]|nr:MBL fold metallo-hydrolase [Caldilineaceae bacterium]
MNTYVLICDETQQCAIIDPGADAEEILAMTAGAQVDKILLTHGHADHVGALAEVKAATGAPVYLHPADAAKFDLAYDVALDDGDAIRLGNYTLRALHTPGHTPGMISLVIDHRVVVGDTLFVGGPGRTVSPADFATTMRTLQTVVFTWADDTEFYPGHGPSGVIGQERGAFEAFVARGWPADLCGDVVWIG